MRRTKIIGLSSGIGLVVVALLLAPSEVRAAETNATMATLKVPEFKRTDLNFKRQNFKSPVTFQYTAMEGVDKYRFLLNWPKVVGSREMDSATIESAKPACDLNKVWNQMPADGPVEFKVVAEAIDAQGKVLAKIASTCTRRPGGFKAGSYLPAKCSYAESGTRAVQWMLKTKPSGFSRPYPCLFCGLYIDMLTTYAKLNPQSEFTPAAVELALEYGRALQKSTTPADWVYANLPTSHGVGNKSFSLTQVHRAGLAGLAYLQLYDLTKDKQWLEASLRIAETLQKTQLPEGRWYWRVNPQTGKVDVDPKTGQQRGDYTSDQAQPILFLDELIRVHGRKELESVRDKAVQWMLDNPCQTMTWANQYEDMGYSLGNEVWWDAALFTRYLLSHATAQNNYEQTALNLLCYIEDRWVRWRPIGGAPCGAGEQNTCAQSMSVHTAIFMGTCQAAHARTGDNVWLQKARALADTLTCIQHPTQGFYPTETDDLKWDGAGGFKNIPDSESWQNCHAYTGAHMLRFDNYVKSVANPDKKGK